MIRYERANKQCVYGFKELDKTIQIIGTDKLIEILKYSREKTRRINQEQIEQALKLVQLVCDEFKITLDDIFGKNRKNNRRILIGICAFIIQKELNLDNSNISIF
jgi:chromosomal replication initiation ATPase DnaA